MKMSHFNPDMTLEQQVLRVYWERDMLLLHYAMRINAYENFLNQEVFCNGITEPACGWYWDKTAPANIQKVISIDRGKRGFHVNTEFDTGDLPEIEPNVTDWSVEDKFNQMAKDTGQEEISWI